MPVAGQSCGCMGLWVCWQLTSRHRAVWPSGWSLTDGHAVALGCGSGVQTASRLAITGTAGAQISVRSRVSTAPAALNKIIRVNDTRGGDAHAFSVAQPASKLNVSL